MSERLSDEELIAEAREWLNTLATPKMIAEEFDAIDLISRLASRLSESLATAEREKKLGVSQRRGD